jgi:hypothetical protein
LFAASILIASIIAVCRRTDQSHRDRPCETVFKLQITVGLLYLSLLFVFVTNYGLYDLAANRFVHDLPGDSRIPHDFAYRIYNGQDPRNLGGDWLSSDRPPAQTGWLLLTWDINKRLGFDEVTFGGATSLWFELIWVAGLYGLLRALGLSSVQATAWSAACALSGFFMLHTVFVWPKLGAGAFACGAFALWILPGQTRNFAGGAVLGSFFAGLAWLSHGSAAFSFILLVPWIVYEVIRGRWRSWILAGAAFVLLTAPWTAYQKLYNPPGNRLLKWHLAGQIPLDRRGFVETLCDNYERAGWSEIWHNKVENFRLLVSPDWWRVTQVSRVGADSRRRQEFLETMHGLTWWLCGLVCAAHLMTSRRIAQEGPLWRSPDVVVFGWVMLTFLAWCLMMFGPAKTVIHQGSFAAMISLFALCSVWLQKTHRYAILVIVALQVTTLATTWLPSTQRIFGPLNGVSVALSVLCAIGLCGFIIPAVRGPQMQSERAGV